MASDPNVIVAAISGILQAAQTWYAHKDSRRAAQEFDKIIGTGRTNPDLVEATKQLELSVPEDIVHSLERRVEQHWVRYAEVLEAAAGTYTEAEIDNATEAAKTGICRELQRIRSIAGTLPPGKFSQWWELYKCE